MLMSIYMQIRMPLACLLILSYSFFYYRTKKRLMTVTSRVFETMAVFALIHLLAAVVTEYTVNNRDLVSPLANHVWHIIFLISVNMVCVLLLFYLILYVERGTGQRKQASKLMLVGICEASVIGELLLPITYVDTPCGSYSLGWKAYALYLTALYVMAMLIVMVVRYHNVISREKSHVLLFSVGIFTVIAGIQILVPQLLLTHLGVTLVVLGIMGSAEDVHIYMSATTGLYNELGFREILQEVVLAERKYKIGIYVFLGRDEAMVQAMKSIQNRLSEKKDRVICAALADNVLAVVPMRWNGRITSMPELPEPDCSNGDTVYTLQIAEFTGTESVDAVFDYIRDFKNRYEENVLQRDELTGLLRRAPFVRQVEYMLKAGQELTFLMIDLDNFKYVNDLHGHSEGDKVLRAVGDAMQELLRSSDILCRMGGDEFGVVLSGLSNREKVREITGRLRSRISAAQETMGHRTEVTLSIGATASGGEERMRTFQEIYAEADSALYRAKYMGKDRLVFSGDK